MAFKLPNRPSTRPTPSELADFAELLALSNGKCSATEIQKYLSRIDDNDKNFGIEDTDWENENLSDAMMAEIGYREKACPDGYPFQTNKTGSCLRVKKIKKSVKPLIYKYLLMATRLNMGNEKIQADIDGTQLMEDLGAAVLRCYLGSQSQTTVFGTAKKGGFQKKVIDLCHALKEGGTFKNIDAGSTNANDDGLDIVGWLPFTDMLPAKLSVFGQCKTGTEWQDHLTRLNPRAFIDCSMSGKIIVDPVKAYFIAESADRSQWSRHSRYSGIFFDRCRIVDLSHDLEIELTRKIETWTNAAFKKLTEWNWIAPKS